MIRINLLGVERQKARKPYAFDPGAQMTVTCSLILVGALSGVGWWYWSLTSESAQVDQEIVVAQRDAARLQTILADVKQFEQRQSMLTQRVGLIQQLRHGQSVPVQLLDHVSRSLPDTLWLTSLEEAGTSVTIEGRSTTLIALSDFVANLGSNVLLKKPIEIINSQVESASDGKAAPDVIRFTVKATLAEAGPTSLAAGARR